MKEKDANRFNPRAEDLGHMPSGEGRGSRKLEISRTTSHFNLHTEWRGVGRTPAWDALWRHILTDVTVKLSDGVDQSERL